VWRLPLWAGYDSELESPLADLKNIGSGPYGGAITAALYLQRFLAPAGTDASGKTLKQTPWIHLDLMAFNTASRPGKPQGGEAMGMRACFEMLHERFGNAK
jgi:leucyl aminopeptidase